MSKTMVSMTCKEYYSGSIEVNGVIFIVHKPIEDAYNAAIARAEKAEAALKEISSLVSFRHGDDENLIGPADEENDDPFEYTIKRIFEILDAHDGAERR